ncbi:MAG: histidine--tRNA ligase [Candidatus Neomarinimicrobiota bacterium]|jgi:histidyl-tRNA synthetase|nr:histidine--tRNA ligase [Candidatus Neomarinimicrobiota bacterium]MEC7872010.1 histidine--tRNA ligase [Candidatus Neomarinimicrobiota bacterium]MEC9436645.1 histidine--tRNA ligase [Candidatus Neomarinimicrobiota bacterium]MED5248522.1 histidine--tRNA ligase [Candidatus Neomarinimicrobiota bacterium]MED5433368.1 histidine--tRNA ligase [Candidatus Neomarinimicrobiota bacterium]|tara:strand:- start:7475 stop:8734 length:1260 start_codon:yes stop_codon:yes gene_type:complete
MSKNQIRSIKGTQDILPDQSYKWQDLENKIHTTMMLYNYGEIRTPAFEKTELFDRGVGTETDIVSKEMYSWTDQGGENLTLKPELTAPVSRSYIQHNLGSQQPLTKLYYIDALFRRERPQKGRFRQFHQFGVEAFGSEHPEIDSEIIAIAVTLFNQIGIKDLTLKLNSIGSENCRENYKKELKEFLMPHFDSLSKASQARFEKNPLRILDSKLPDEIDIIKNAPLISEFWTKDDKDHFDELCSYLDAMNISYSIDPNLVRGLDYYSRTTFEIISSSLGAQDAICGGGRYDRLVETIGGKPTPGIGFAAGMERILMSINHGNSKESIKIYIVGLGEKVRPVVAKLTNDLRHNNLSSECDMLRRSMRAQMREANKLGAKYAIIIGDNELQQNRAQLKDLTSGNQETIDMDSIVSHITSLSF